LEDSYAGVDATWEQKKLEARKMPVNCATSYMSAARFVGRFLAPDSLTGKNVIAIHKV
jgi:hypothetical protein